MEESTVPDDKSRGKKNDRPIDDRCEGQEGLRVLSVDKVSVEKIVVETDKSREILSTKSESTKRISELRKTFLSRPKTVPEKLASSKSGNGKDNSFSRIKSRFGNNVATTSSEKKQTGGKGVSKLPISRSQKSGNATSLSERRISPIRLTKNSSIGSLIRASKSSARICKVPPKVSKKSEELTLKRSDPGGSLTEEPGVVEEKLKEKSETESKPKDREADEVEEVEPKREDSKSAAQNRLERSQSKIERLQRDLWTKINASTAETYKLRLIDPHANSSARDLDLNENVTKGTFDKEFLERHNFDKKLRIEENLPLDLDCVPDAERTRVAEETERRIDKPRYSRKVSEVEKRWSSEFLVHNSSGSSKSSYVEELGSISSHESIVGIDPDRSDQIRGNYIQVLREGNDEFFVKLKAEKVPENTISTVDSDSCFEDRIKAVDEDLDVEAKEKKIEEALEENGSKESTLKESSVVSYSTSVLSTREVSEDAEKGRGWSGEKEEDDTLKDLDEINKDEVYLRKTEKRILIPSEVEEESFRTIGNIKTASRNVSLVLYQDERHEENTSASSDELKKTVSVPFDRKEEPEKREELRLTETKDISFENTKSDLPAKAYLKKDGYANIIKEFKMEAEISRISKDEKKRKGFRRLIPGLFSPKDSRKEYKKDQKERKKREEKRFSQHQQNGNYIRSPDTMNLNEDIKRNVKLDASLNSTVIEERLNEIKQELFPDQDIITSTPDHFLQIDRNLLQDGRAPRSCTIDSSLSSLAPEDKLMEHSIISGSPDMRQLKQRKLENDRKCGLERKHSLQETTQPRFIRNHGPTGRISAPPGGRFLIRPRAVHPVDRPLPAIPQRVEFSNFENDKRQVHRQPSRDVSYARRRPDLQGYPRQIPCPSKDRNYENDARLYENSEGLEKSQIGGNRSADSRFSLTPVSAQVKITRQLIVNQNPKASLAERSPKCSPNSSHQSGDYADSSYTPNSSQKSEFSPSSSKSGEYYLGSPRNSARASPNDAFGDRREQTMYSVSPSANVQSKTDRIYDETPTSRCGDNGSPERACKTCSPVPRSFNQTESSPVHASSVNQQEAVYAQRCSPNIPMSSNLAKLRANVETAGSRTDVPSVYQGDNATRRSSNESSSLIRIASPVSIVKRIGSPVSDSASKDRNVSPIRGSPRVSSPVRMQRVTSPLTIVPPSGPSPSPISPTGTTSNGIPFAPRVKSLSPSGGQNIKSQVSSPIGSTRSKISPGSESYVLMSSKRSQPNDQILIASPKREAIYEPHNRRLAARLESGCPESPIPMADSPSQILGSRQSTRQTVAERLERCMSPVIGLQVPEPADVSVDSKQSPQRILTIRRTMSPSSMGSTPSPKNIKRPEPIYVQRQHAQCALSPVKMPIPLDVRKQSVITSSGALEPEQGRTISPDCNPKQERIHIDGKTSDAREATSTPRSPQNRERDRSNNEQIYAGRQVQQSLAQIPIVSPLRNTEPAVYVPRQDGGAQRVSTPKTQPPIYSLEQCKLSPSSPEQIYVPRPGAHQEPVYSQRQQDSAYSQNSCEPVYGHHSGRQSSPSKRQTMQHLEAFYWQQKALEAQRRSMTSPSSLARQNETKLELPEMREAMYWQQLKMLDEEQQKRIYEQNLMGDRNDPLYWRRKLQSPPTSPVINNVTRHGSSPNLINQSLSLPTNTDQLYWRSKLQQPKSNPVGKPPITGQKGQHQPVLVVRPQPAVQESNRSNRKTRLDSQDSSKQEAVPRSKSVSPHLVRSDERRSLSLPRKSAEIDDGGFLRTNREKSTVAALRKPETPPIYEEENEVDRKPPPIFKRGSLISNSSSSVDYGTVGPKRVSFSNHSNCLEIGARIWPTKHGMAPEPPTRKHKTDRTSTNSESDSVFLHEEENQNNANTNVYGNVLARSVSFQTEGPGVDESFDTSRSFNFESEYDANRPLPPPPRESSWLSRCSIGAKEHSRSESNPKIDFNRTRSATSIQKWPDSNEYESGSEAGEMQRISVQRKQEEEWNPDGKGRQTNDTGGSGRGEGEGGPNDLPGGRRGAGGGGSRGSGGTGSGNIGRSRDEPRRHTLSGDHQPSLHHQQFNAQQLHPLHPHHLPPPHGQYGTPANRHTTMDLEMGTKSRQRKSPLPRGYPPPSTAMLFDDDPGIMSEVETSSTGFRRGGKQRSSLPVVRTPSKTLERPLGLVFLQYRNETKRALLPNEITSIDTVKALFVRSFPKQLTMEYLDSPHVKVYIHDSNKDMFYELEDLRSHLRDIRDRSVLRLFESDGAAGMPGPLGALGGSAGLPPHWEDQSYFSEPEFDSEFQHQHIHKSKTAKNSTSGNGGYYMGSSSTLPRGGPLLRAYSPAVPSVVAGPNSTPNQPKTLNTPGGGGVAPAKPLRSYQCGKNPLGSLGGSARFSRDSSVSLYSIPDRLHGESGYMSSPERGGGVGTGTGRYPAGPYSTGSSYEDPYYSQYSGTVTPVIDEEASDTELLEESYSLYGVKPPGRPPSGPPRSPFPPGAPPLPPGGQPYDATRIRVEHMERQLANLTGLVQKALTHAPHSSPLPRDYLQVPAVRDPYRTAGAGDEFDKHSSSSSASLPDDSYLRTDVKPPKLGKDKSVSFEKSVSFSDEPPDMNSPKQHSPQHAADTKPTKPAIKSSTLPRMSSQERERHKPTPPPKPAALAAGQYVYRDLALTPEMYNQLRGLQKKAKDLRQEVRNLRRMSQAQAHTVRETIRDTFITIRAMLLSGEDAAWASGDTEKIRLSREEDLYKQEMIRLEKDLTELESTVEELRGNVINRKTRVNMSDVENMALILSKSSKTVADLKVRFPSLQEGMKGLLSSEMEKVVREEKFLKEEPDRLESALRRCKKLTGTLVTLKRLASVQEQRLPNAMSAETEETPPVTPTSAQHSKTTTPVPAERTVVGSASIIGGGSYTVDSSTPHQQRPENALDALLDELQTFSRPASQLSQTSSIGHLTNHPPTLSEIGRSASQIVQASRAPSMSDIGRKGSIDSSTSLAIVTPGHTNTLRRLHSYPSSSDTDTSPPIARLQVSDGSAPPQKPPVPERNTELLQLATARRVPPPPPPRTSSRSPLASPTSPQLLPRNPTGTLRRGRGNAKDSGKPPMALPPSANMTDEQVPPNNILSASNSSSCESINSQEGLQNKKGRQEQLEQRHQELLRKQKALQEQYARLQQLQRNASGVTTVPPAPPDLLKKTGSESNLLAKMGLGLSTASSGSLTSLTAKTNQEQGAPLSQNVSAGQTTTNKIYETDIL